ncbi:hypothetical protein GCM10010977_00930 [Citricoccus zhacaiensis]|uniref:Uncharacterized protein n=1 Tax=Citricoccus zhacaiensis TaxID=489142 RepID=A0ABQ2LPJ0_9MICC|nr:hypothetical protein GCM10010977_00930 [Citricoccus zhacaiensis]
MAPEDRLHGTVIEALAGGSGLRDQAVRMPTEIEVEDGMTQQVEGPEDAGVPGLVFRTSADQHHTMAGGPLVRVARDRLVTHLVSSLLLLAANGARGRPPFNLAGWAAHPREHGAGGPETV